MVISPRIRPNSRTTKVWIANEKSPITKERVMLFAQSFVESFFELMAVPIVGLILLFSMLPKGTGTGAAKVGLSALLRSLFGK